MFNLNEIDFIRTDKEHGRRAYSFVGIQRSKRDNERLEFWLPFGFDDFAKNDSEEENFELTKKFFFKMYRTFKTYLERRKLRETPLTSDEIKEDRDGLVELEDGFSFVNENNEQVLFYSKLNALDKILEGYDELRISSLEKKQVRTQEVDFSKIHHYLHKAIYLEEDVIYLDEMNLPKNILVRESPPILQLFCFIYSEIKKELEEDETIPTLAVELAEQFKENYLQIESSLFAQDTFSDTINTLKHTLEEIDQRTTYKDEDYWHFFDAVEAFLYGEMKDDKQGVYFGISSFYDIWEDMCQTYILDIEPYKTQAIFADVNGYLENLKGLVINPYHLTLNKGNKNRHIRPDLVLRNKESFILSKENLYQTNQIRKNNRNAYGVKFQMGMYDLQNNHPELYSKYQLICQKEPSFTGGIFSFVYETDFNTFELFVNSYLAELSIAMYRIVDYKYMRVSDYQEYNPFQTENGENKITNDIHKQLIYEWTTQQNFENTETESEFWIPYYSTEKKLFSDPVLISNPIFIRSKIKIIQVDFDTLQNHYIKYLQTV